MGGKGERKGCPRGGRPAVPRLPGSRANLTPRHAYRPMPGGWASYAPRPHPQDNPRPQNHRRPPSTSSAEMTSTPPPLPPPPSRSGSRELYTAPTSVFTMKVSQVNHCFCGVLSYSPHTPLDTFGGLRANSSSQILASFRKKVTETIFPGGRQVRREANKGLQHRVVRKRRRSIQFCVS